MVVIESFILKKPMVVARFGSITEMMDEGKHGYIADQSVDSLCEIIKKMISNDGSLDCCRRFFETYEFSNEVAYSQFLKAIGDNK